MDNEYRLSGSLQENVLTVLVFDDEYCRQIRAAVTHRTFESAVYREVAGAAIDFIDNYGAAIKEHLADSLEHFLKGEDARKAQAYERLLANLFQAREHINSEYVMSQLQKFVRGQKFKSALMDAVAVMENSGDIDKAEVIMQEGMRSQSVVFDRGTALDNADDVAAVFDDPEEEGFDLGIEELDRHGIIPRRKEVLMLVAARGKGKSWFIVHCAKQALIQRWSVVVITLEMSRKRYAARFLQAFFSITRRDALVRVTRIIRDREGNLEDIIHEELERRAMTDPETRVELIKRAKQEFKRRAPIRIRDFPAGEMTMQMLEAYLDGLERHDKFTPDVICLDYPDEAKLDPKNLRLELRAFLTQFRGMCTRRNAAGIVVSQGTRESEDAKMVTGGMVAEDIGKLGTVDVMLTYSQTLAEYALGLARLFVEKARNEKAKMVVLLTQAYDIGQFCMDSVAVKMGDYFDMLDEKNGKRRRHDDDDDDDAPRDRRTARGRRRDD